MEGGTRCRRWHAATHLVISHEKDHVWPPHNGRSRSTGSTTAGSSPGGGGSSTAEQQ
eukprot:SAG11_NODE_10001_length_863_cov_1.344241_3_plen_56_part_01